MLQILSTFSFNWLIMGGNVRIHQVGYYLVTTIIIIVWLSGTLFAEDKFRSSIDIIRVRRGKIERSSKNRPSHSLVRLLERLGLDVLVPRVLIALAILLNLIVLNYLFRQAFFFIYSQFGPS